jgi:hypothetical protein
MHHQLGRILGRIVRIALGPVVPDSVREALARVIERAGRDGAADVGEALEAHVLLDVPEAEGAVGAAGRDTVLEFRVAGDCVDGPDASDVAAVWAFAVALPCEVDCTRPGLGPGARHM